MYLGVAVGANMALKRYWLHDVGRTHNQLSSWKAKRFSFDGHLTLVISVLGSLPSYFFSLFKAPKSIIDILEKL